MRFVVHLLLSIVFVNVFGVLNADTEVPAPRSELLRETEALLLHVATTVRAAIAVGIEQNDALNADLTAHSKDVAGNATEEIQTRSEALKSQLGDLGTLAESMGVQHCMDGSDLSLAYATELLVSEILLCIDQTSNEALGIINNISLTISYAQLKVAGLGRGLQQCINPVVNDDCVFFIKNELEYAHDELPTAIMDQSVEALMLSVDTRVMIQNCADHRTGLINVEGQRMISDVQSCILGSSENAGSKGM